MATAAPTDVVRACVVSGGITTPYQVAGRGLPTLVLSMDREAVARLLRSASPFRRVIAPELSSTSTADAHSRAWLVAFIEALGLEGVRLLVDASFAGAAHGVATVYPELVAAVDLVSPTVPVTP